MGKSALRTMEKKDSAEQALSLKEVCDILSISRATAKNWIRLGKLHPEKDGVSFDRQYIEILHGQLKSGGDNRLKSRRNKKAISGKALYRDYIDNAQNQTVIANMLQTVLQTEKCLTDEELRIILANFAVQLYYQSRKIPYERRDVLRDYLVSATDKVFYELILDLLRGEVPEEDPEEWLRDFLECDLAFVPTEDTLGFVYLSLRDLGSRKASGAYYTPLKIVNMLLEGVCECADIEGKAICDPCCGTGNFLIGLVNRGMPVSHIYGQDIDELSIQIARINVFLLCHTVTREEIYSHFICGNTLQDVSKDKFHILLGNPPWGSAFSEDEVKYFVSRYRTAKRKGTESFELFIERALSMLEEEGILAFVLPESVLNVASHTEVRRLLLERCSFRFVFFLGNAFSGVQCPAIILGVRRGGFGSTVGCRVRNGGRAFTITGQRTFEDTVLELNITDGEQECLRAISSVLNPRFLQGNAGFALGIVTGDNEEYIKREASEGYETVLRGSDIWRYAIRPGENYIRFEPEQFQQAAPAEMYRAPEKLLYRFISEVPVFAYDNSGMLSLNSCNILIPRIEGLHIKYVLAVLNSSVAAFYLCKKYDSVKMLRSHLERFPIAGVSFVEQEPIIEAVDHLMESTGNLTDQYRALDRKIMELYGLSLQNRRIIEEALRDKNLFLKTE